MIYIEVIFGAINGSAIAIDSELSETSTNPVQNKVIKAALDAQQQQMSNIIHAFTIDFQDTREIVQMRNMSGSVKLKRIKTDNVATLSVFVNGTKQTITLTEGEWNGQIAIAADALMVWSIGRTAEGEIASINVQYEYNS